MPGRVITVTTPAPHQPPLTARVLRTDELAGPTMDAHARERLRRLLRELARCRMGQLLLRHAVDQRIVIRFDDGDELVRFVGRAAGMYHARSRTLVVDGALAFDDQLATLAHELQHFVDGVLGWQLGTIESEVRANQSEALVIQQLRLRARSWGIVNGQLRHPEDIAAKVRAHPGYARNVPETPRIDGRVHPLLEAREVLPPMLSVAARTTGSSGSMSVGAVGAIAAPSSVAPLAPTSHMSGATQAATSALAAARPTCFDPTPAWHDDTPVGTFLSALDAQRLACGA